ncbi:hypothetical protein H5410_003604 [Solanum commersonii]|uniref:Secreted protein n=1 Tax=Solanum commersonii TaxID=4109 RepID=A0A9J6B636_SOLCO|nr:hypothetical protein H5410_003604 [Solanum commersonii]
MLFSLISICSSSVSASDSSVAMSSICTSPVVIDGISDVAGASSVSVALNKVVVTLTVKLSTKAPRGVSASKIVASIIHSTAASNLVALTSAEWAKPDGPKAEVGKDAYVGIESMSTFGDISTGAALFLSASSRVYSASIRLISIDEEGITLISLVISRGTPACWHNSVIKIGNGRKVYFCLALMVISCSIRSPRLMLLLDMIDPRQVALGWHRMDSFWDGMIVLLMKPNQNQAAILRSLLSIGSTVSIHLEVVSEINRASQPLKSSKD